MTSNVVYTTGFPSLHETDTVAAATQQMLDQRVVDLPVVDAAGNLLGMLTLARLLEVVLPRAALLDYGMPDLAFSADSLEQLRERMGEVKDKPVRDFIVKPKHHVNARTSPVEIALLLYKGANAIPVLADDGDKLIGMVTPRDLLGALSAGQAR